MTEPRHMINGKPVDVLPPYGCFNRPEYKAERQVQDGWTDDGRRLMKTIPDPMRKDCHYGQTEFGRNDPRCAGCKRLVLVIAGQ